MTHCGRSCHSLCICAVNSWSRTAAVAFPALQTCSIGERSGAPGRPCWLERIAILALKNPKRTVKRKCDESPVTRILRNLLKRNTSVDITWRQPSAHTCCRSQSLGTAAKFDGNRNDQTAGVHLASGLLRSVRFSGGCKTSAACTKCNTREIKHHHLFSCVALTVWNTHWHLISSSILADLENVGSTKLNLLVVESGISHQIWKWEIINLNDPNKDNREKLLNYCIVIGPQQV
ncbi:hypothetical protein TNCV_714301 [Trichonephila clavipes]|nr:hypothetical protein TNCV_714301 [Trichonephila clavipes]